MAQKKTSKQLAKAYSAFRQAVTEYIIGLGAVKGSFYDYELTTPAGLLHLSVWDTTLMTRFDDVDRAKHLTASCSQSCNPYSGKWNFHFSNDPDSLRPDAVLSHLRHYLDALMSWREPVPASANVDPRPILFF